MPSILDLSIKRGGLDFSILSFAFWLISVFKSKRVTGIFALQSCAAIPLPIVPEPITTTLLIFIKNFYIKFNFVCNKKIVLI